MEPADEQLQNRPGRPCMTPTELMIKVMEEFSVSEPLSCIVVFTNVDGQLCMRMNTDRPNSIGMLQLACQMLFTGQGMM